MYRPSDLTGRATILPDPTLHIDEAKIPKTILKEMFQPFIIQNLVKKGVSPVDAAKMLANDDPAAVQALHEVAQSRPVILNRAPTLHKYNCLAFKAIPVAGHSIFISPLTTKGYNADESQD